MPDRDPLDELARGMALGLRRRTILRLAGASVCAAIGAAVMPQSWRRSSQAEADSAIGPGQSQIQDQVPGGGGGTSPGGGGAGAGGAGATGGSGTAGGASGGGAAPGSGTVTGPPLSPALPTGTGGGGQGVLINGTLLGTAPNDGYIRLNGSIFCKPELVQAGTCCPLGVDVASSLIARVRPADEDLARGPGRATDGGVAEPGCLGGRYCQGTACGQVITPANSPCSDWPSDGGLPTYIGCTPGFTCCNRICCLPGQACVAGVCQAILCSAASGCPYGLPCCSGVCCLTNQTCVSGVCQNPPCGPNLPCPALSRGCCNGVCCPVGQYCSAGVCTEGPY